jgi:hypothetical protein
MIDELFPNGGRLELFGKNRADGWDVVDLDQWKPSDGYAKPDPEKDQGESSRHPEEEPNRKVDTIERHEPPGLREEVK